MGHGVLDTEHVSFRSPCSVEPRGGCQESPDYSAPRARVEMQWFHPCLPSKKSCFDGGRLEALGQLEVRSGQDIPLGGTPPDLLVDPRFGKRDGPRMT